MLLDRALLPLQESIRNFSAVDGVAEQNRADRNKRFCTASPGLGGARSAWVWPHVLIRILVLVAAQSGCLPGQLWAQSYPAPATFLGFRASPSSGSSAVDIQMLRMRVTATTPSTYFEAFGWDAGEPGGGYAGIQDASTGGGYCGTGPDTGYIYIFSLWDAPSGEQSFVVYTNPTGTTCRFGGEGTGVHYLNYAMPWRVGSWYQLVVRAWNYGASTYYALWSYDESANVWTDHATLGYPATGVFMDGTPGAFLEDFGETGQNIRAGEYNEAWLRAVSKQWVGLGYAVFAVNTSATNNGPYYNSFDAGTREGAFYMQCGGDTTPSAQPGALFSLPEASAVPSLSVGTTLSAGASYSVATGQLIVSWSSDPKSSPQFGYEVDVFDNSSLSGSPVFSQSDVAPDVRSISTNIALTGTTYFVRIVTTDIFDHPAAPIGTAVSMLDANPAAMTFTATVGGSAPAPQNLEISVPISTTFVASTSEQSCTNSNWLAISPSGNVIATLLTTNVAVSVNPLGITGDTTCNGAINITAAGSSQTVRVVMVVVGQVIYTSLGTNQTFSSNGSCVSGNNNSACGPDVTRWIAGSFTPSGTFTLSSIDLALGNISGTNGAVIVLTSNEAGGMPGTTAIEQWTLSSLPSTGTPGIASVTSRINPILSTNQTYWVVAEGLADDSMDFWFANNRGLTGGMSNANDGGWVQITQPAFEVLGSPLESPLPTINSGGVVNAATFQGGGIAPNEFISILGSGLGPMTGASANLSTLVAGTKLLINGTPAQLTYAQYNQVNAIVPWGVQGSVSVQVEYDGIQGNTITVDAVGASPGIFTESYGPGQAWVVNQDSTFNSANNPAPRNTVIAFWATGQGLVNISQQDGTQPIGPPFLSPLLPISVTLGTVNVPASDILFNGLIYSGEIQVNIRIPETAPTGSSVPLVLSIGTSSSRSDATIAIQ